MRAKRVIGTGPTYYHCMTRVVGGERLLGSREKEVLRRMLWQVAEFCGVRILTYAVMSNHFHVLVHLPGEEARLIDDEELGRRYEVLYERSCAPWQPKPAVLRELLRENTREGRRWRERLRARMGDVSVFMKTVKQRFSIWYNKTHGRYGTLWASRFKSVLVEGDTAALITVAAYIDLNPVRAGLAEDPAQYRWCGYAEAMGGAGAARDGLAKVYRESSGGWAEISAKYRCLLFGVGSGGALEKGKIPKARVLTILQSGGDVSLAEALRCRVRYFSDGAVLGSAAFVEEVGEVHRVRSTRKRKAVSHPMEGGAWSRLTVLRGLRQNIFS
jgi:putative transposase